MLDVRSYHPEDYAAFNGWVNTYGWGDIPSRALPPTGLVVYGAVSNLPMAMGFLYMQPGCDLCIMDFVVADPALSAGRKLKATQLVIDSLIKLAKDKTNGAGWLYSMSPNKAYIKIAQTQGFKIAEQEVTTIFYPLNGEQDRVGFLCSEIKE